MLLLHLSQGIATYLLTFRLSLTLSSMLARIAVPVISIAMHTQSAVEVWWMNKWSSVDSRQKGDGGEGQKVCLYSTNQSHKYNRQQGKTEQSQTHAHPEKKKWRHKNCSWQDISSPSRSCRQEGKHADIRSQSLRTPFPRYYTFHCVSLQGRLLVNSWRLFGIKIISLNHDST